MSALPVSTHAVENAQPELCSRAIADAREYLLNLQKPDGHWIAELQGDTILESEYILLLAYLGEERSEIALRAARYILEQQQDDGSWSNYTGGPCEISVSVKAYFALKLTGHDPQSDYMVKARERIRAEGGAEKCNSFTKFYLALLGVIPYSSVPSVPVEMVLLPRWFPINLYAMSSWTRTIVVPLSICSAFKPVRQLPPQMGIQELFLNPETEPAWIAARSYPRWTWQRFFLNVDWLYKKIEGWLGPIRRWAVDRAAQWMRERLKGSDGLGAIFPPMIYTVIVLRCLGVSDDDPEMKIARQQLDDFIIEENETVRLQPCFSPVWDTALTLNAMAEAGLGHEHVAIQRAVNWLMAREVRQKGDWSLMLPQQEPAGWFFEYNNPFYPDTDDTSMVLLGFARTGAVNQPMVHAATERAVSWLRRMQNRDGGWAAFDRDVTWEVLTKVPFADHNAMLDPSCPDITARVLEALGVLGATCEDPQVKRGLDFIEQTQDPRGCWPGRWGVNYLYGTWQVLVGLAAVGFDMQRPFVRKAVDWLVSVQQEGGAWGESCASYDDPEMAGRGEATPSQTAWALMALIAADEVNNEAVHSGIDYLIRTQRSDGGWDEEPFTGTGFPKVFYLKYHYYAIYFPLMALSRYSRLRGKRTRSNKSTRSSVTATSV